VSCGIPIWLYRARLRRGYLISSKALPGLRESLAQAKAGKFAQVHKPQQIAARRRGRPVGSTQAVTKEAVKIRLDADVLAALRASGDGWQTRINDRLRASLALSGAGRIKNFHSAW